MVENPRMTLAYDAAAMVLAAAGDVTQADVEQLARSLRVHTAVGDLTVDLTGVTYLPSSALSVLVRARARAADRGVVLTISATPGSAASQLLAVAGIRG